ncbi:MAG: hypothetical protein HQL51_04205 [Magnetococcales bacterium]|nr:hypothetical protein [Magnetococcales bacterium]
MARLTPLADSSRSPRTLGLGKGQFTLPPHFDALHAAEIQAMFETGG